MGIVNRVFPETNPDWMSVPGANCWPGSQAAGHILREVRRHADWVLVILHWSDEEFSYSRSEDRRIPRDIVCLGAHVLIGHHPHVVRGMEMIEKTPVFYSAGDFFFSDFGRGENDQNSEIKMAPRNREALGVKLRFTKGSHPRFQLYSFYQASNETRVDSRRRAEKRLTVCSRVLEHMQDHAYKEWYQRRWERFFKWEAKWHYGVRKRGVFGHDRYAAKRLKPNPAGAPVAR